MAITVEEMLKMSQAQLDDLFTQSPTAKSQAARRKARPSSRRAQPTRRTWPIS